MLRPSGSIVLPFKIKKASLALRIESLSEKTFSMGISCMSLAVWLGEDRKMRNTEMKRRKEGSVVLKTPQRGYGKIKE